MQLADPHFGAHLVELARAGEIRNVRGNGAPAMLLGSGESYAAWQVPTTDGVVLVRVARRKPEGMPRPISAEFAALQQVPPELGTRGIAYDDTTDNALGRAYVVTTFVRGRVRPGEIWTPQDVAVHARQLARLHTLTGSTTQPASPASAEAFAGLDWWQSNHPEIVKDPRVQRLLGPWQEYLVARDAAWQGCVSQRLIHSDLVVPNIVVGDDGLPRYIDWEWGESGDAAKDLALFGGRITGGPWYVRLDDDGLCAFVDEYCRARTEFGSPVDAEQLTIQRDAWEMAERMLGCLHFLTRASDDAMYRAATDHILADLTRVLLPAGR